MSFVPTPQQANAAGANNVPGVTPANAATAVAANAAEVPAITDQELMFKMRTFDVTWVEKSALMYKDGIAKVRKILDVTCRIHVEIKMRRAAICRLAVE